MAWVRVSALPFIIIGLAQEENRTSQPSKFAMAPFAPSQRMDVTFHYAASLYVLLIHNDFKYISCKR